MRDLSSTTRSTRLINSTPGADPRRDTCPDAATITEGIRLNGGERDQGALVGRAAVRPRRARVCGQYAAAYVVSGQLRYQKV
jgi:hypothetical protein